MEIRELQTFIVLADTLSYQKASEQLGYAPSTLNHHIRSLEQKLGVTLFVKVGKQIQMTAEALAFLEHARGLLISYEEALGSVAKAKRMEERISIGGCEMTVANGLVNLLSSYTDTRQNVRIRLRTSANAQVPDMVRENAADVGFYYSLDKEHLPGLQAQELFMEPVRLMVAPDSPFADRKNVRYSELEGINLAFPHDDCPCVLGVLEELSRRRIALGCINYLGVLPLVIEKLRSDQAAVATPYSSTRRFKEVYGLEVVDLAEEDIWMNVRVVYRSFDALRSAGKELVRHSLRFAHKMIQEDPRHFRMPEACMRQSVL